MNNKIKNVLLKLIDNGFEAYIVGGFVRDYLLGIESYDVDISTNALPKDIKEIFGLPISNEDNYGSICFKDSLYNYDITTFRKEVKYENRRPIEYVYIDSIEEDLLRRDFTINALYMDVNGEVFDLINGIQDLEDGIIRVIGSVNDKMVEDPLRLLRAIRFATILNFQIDTNIFQYIRQNKQLIRTLSYTRRKEELSKIFRSNNNMYGLNLLRDLNVLDELEISFDVVKPCSNEFGIWAQMEYTDMYQFKKNECDIIDDIRSVLKYGIIDNVVLYQYGLYVCVIAGEILGINQSSISEVYKNLPIYSARDIQVTGEDIMKILNIEPGEKIKNIFNDLELNILNNTLSNNYDKIKEYLWENWR